MIKRFARKIVFFYVKIVYRINNGYIAGALMKAFVQDFKEKKLPFFEIISIHKKGFTVSDWTFLELNKENYKKYLSNVEYYRMHPLNGKNSYIIDDKLTLKKYCADTELDKYMPRYYYRINADGVIEKLMDCPYESEHHSAEDVAKLLKDCGSLAIKQTSGSLGIGFYKGEYKNGNFCLNDEEMDEHEFCTRISQLKNYLITEYLYPHKQLAEYCPYTCNCIRYLIGRVNGEMKLLKSYIRFGTEQSGFVENYNSGGILCYLNDRGEFSEGNVIDYKSGLNRKINEHCDSKVKLSGTIPLWNEVELMREAFDEHMPQMNYLGIDVVITSDNQVKVLEINSLTSLDGLQLNGSILDTEAGEFFGQYL